MLGANLKRYRYVGTTTAAESKISKETIAVPQARGMNWHHWILLQCWGPIRIRMFLGLPDPDPLLRGTGTDPSPALDPSLFSLRC
jgi:hypothetical protein